MGRLNFDYDEATLLKAYRISSLNPTRWEDVDHEQDGSAAGSLLDGPAGKDSVDTTDPLGLNDRGLDFRDLDIESRAAVMVSSKSFDPKAFLSTAHPNATHQDLTAGKEHLRRVLESRSEAIRTLVEDNFDHFVAVKASTETLRTYMQDGVLEPQSEYGSKQLNERLRQSSAKADQVFLPILENAAKANRVRSTLGVFERSKFFFNLPGSLVESIEMGRFEVAMRDYNKGKFLLESRPGQLIAAAGASSTTASEPLAPQQKRIVDKVWGAVEKVMAQMRNLLIAQLREPTRSVEEQVKTIEVLLDMNSADDPVWIYFDSQHKHILAHLRKIHDESLETIQKARADLVDIKSSALSPESLTEDLRSSIAAIDSTSPETTYAKSVGADVWAATVALARNLSEGLLTSLPPFWKIAKDYMDGKFKKNGATSSSRRSPSQCRTMALEIVRLYIALISEFFSLSDKAVVSPSRDSTDLPSFIPRGSNSIVSAFYLSRILSDINESVGDVTTAELAGDAASGLRSLLESARWRFEVAICDVWLQDAVRLHELETWELDPEKPSLTLYLTTTLQKFQIHSATSAYKIAGGIDASKHGAVAAKQIPIGREFGQRIQKTFVDSLYALLDGLEKLSRRDYTPPPSATLDVMATPKPLAQHSLDVTDRDARMLLVTAAFGYIHKQVIPSLVNKLESALSVSIGRERDMLDEVVEQLDESLFTDYVKEKSTTINAIIRRGISESGMDWYETPRPTEVRDYIYQALMVLVKIHSQVSGIAKPLLDRTMNSLVDDLTNEAFNCFQKVEKFGMGGMLRATLEIEFIHQTLVQYVSPGASKTLAAIYNSISAAYQRKGTAGSDSLQKELEGVKRTLHDSRRATAIEFLCFKPTKDIPAAPPIPGGSTSGSGGSTTRPTTPAGSSR